MRKIALTVLGMSLVLATVGCSSSDSSGGEDAVEERSSEQTSAPTPSPPSATPTETADPFAPNVGDRALRVGQTRKGEDVTTRLIEVKYPYPGQQYRQPEPGIEWFGFRVESCLRDAAANPAQLSGGIEWFAIDRQEGQYRGGKGYWVDFPTPQFPEFATIQPGECVSGWMLIDLPEGTKVTKLVWRPGDVTTAEWIR